MKPCQKTFFLLAFLFGLFGVAKTSQAANWYVRDSSYAEGSNNGTDWTNAWRGSVTWASVSAGDTIYLAGGDYTNAWTITKGGSAGNVITLKRATVGEHGTATGWSAGLDSQVHFDGVGITVADGGVGNYNEYITIDGQVGTDGIFIDFTGGELGYGINLTQNNDGSGGNIILKHLKIWGVQDGGTAYGNTRAIQGANLESGSTTRAQNLLIDQCDIGYYTSAMINLYYWSGVTISNSLLHHASNQYESTPHEDILMMYYSDDVDIYNNRIYGVREEGLYFETGMDDITIYNNIFYQPSDFLGDGNAAGSAGSDNITNVRIYNNVIDSFNNGIRHNDAGDTGDIQNNIFLNNNFDIAPGGASTHDYNAYDGTTSETHGQANITAALFTDYVNRNYHLTGHTNAGTPLTAYLTVDADGAARSYWDRGAYEYVSGGDIIAPSAPSGLSVS